MHPRIAAVLALHVRSAARTVPSRELRADIAEQLLDHGDVDRHGTEPATPRSSRPTRLRGSERYAARPLFAWAAWSSREQERERAERPAEGWVPTSFARRAGGARAPPVLLRLRVAPALIIWLARCCRARGRARASRLQAGVAPASQAGMDNPAAAAAAAELDAERDKQRSTWSIRCTAWSPARSSRCGRSPTRTRWSSAGCAWARACGWPTSR